tara:strand:- start:3771 stop:5246 length:1476 start_codon:yes stop_codon:yes gene_type:complete
MAIGAMTLEQKPIDTTDKLPVITNWTPVIGYMPFQDDISGLFFFRLILELYQYNNDGTLTTLIAKLKQRRNGYGPDNNGGTQRARAFFDLKEIINSVAVDTTFDQNESGLGTEGGFQSIHTLGGNTDSLLVYSVNGNSRREETQIVKIKALAFQEYSDSATASPKEFPNPNASQDLWYIQASLPLLTPRNTDAEFIQSDVMNLYIPKSATSLFLSDIQESTAIHNIGKVRRNYVDDFDYHTLAFLNDFDKFDSLLCQMKITYYNADGTVAQASEVILNSATYGGQLPASVLKDTERILYFGCGPANLREQTANTSAQPPTDWDYYTVQGTACTTGNAVTKLYYFIKDECTKYKRVRLAFRNSLGCYDYFNFNMKSTETTDITRNKYNTLLGEFSSSKYYYNNTQRGQTIRSVSATTKETLETNWITEEDAVLLKSLFVSSNVYIIKNKNNQLYNKAVIITNTNYTKKTSVNDSLIRYTINIEYSNSINTNS